MNDFDHWIEQFNGHRDYAAHDLLRHFKDYLREAYEAGHRNTYTDEAFDHWWAHSKIKQSPIADLLTNFTTYLKTSYTA